MLKNYHHYINRLNIKVKVIDFKSKINQCLVETITIKTILMIEITIEKTVIEITNHFIREILNKNRFKEKSHLNRTTITLSFR